MGPMNRESLQCIAFIQSMPSLVRYDLRGRGAGRDAYSKYQPWSRRSQAMKDGCA